MMVPSRPMRFTATASSRATKGAIWASSAWRAGDRQTAAASAPFAARRTSAAASRCRGSSAPQRSAARFFSSIQMVSAPVSASSSAASPATRTSRSDSRTCP